MPHSQLLSWSVDDRVKLLAWLYEDAVRCSLCGTAEWEWSDQYAFIPSVHICQGCAMRENAREMAKDVAGGTVVLLSGQAKKEELAKQRDAYLAAARAKREKG